MTLSRRTILLRALKGMTIGSLGLSFLPLLYRTRVWNESSTLSLPIVAKRGSIWAQERCVVAHDVPYYKIVLLTALLNSRVRESLTKLGTFLPRFNGDAIQLEKDKPFTLLLDHLYENEISTFMQHKQDLPGLYICTDYKRHYPWGACLEPILGDVDKYFDATLKGLEGITKLSVSKDKHTLVKVAEMPPIPGKDITLTLRMPLQQKIWRYMKGIEGICLITEVKTGRLLVYVSTTGERANSRLYKADGALGPLATLAKLMGHSSVSPLARLFGLGQDFCPSVNARVSTLQLATMITRIAARNLFVTPFLVEESIPYKGNSEVLYDTWWDTLHAIIKRNSPTDGGGQPSHALWQLASAVETPKDLFIGYAPIVDPLYSITLLSQKSNHSPSSVAWNMMHDVMENHPF